MHELQNDNLSGSCKQDHIEDYTGKNKEPNGVGGVGGTGWLYDGQRNGRPDYEFENHYAKGT